MKSEQEPGTILIPGDGATGDQDHRIRSADNVRYTALATCRPNDFPVRSDQAIPRVTKYAKPMNMHT
jgi:hypothetical protein